MIVEENNLSKPLQLNKIKFEATDKPWIEKYRPQQLSDVVGNEEIIAQLRIIGKQGNLPNMILTGPPGTGKTTSVLAIAKELLGDKVKIAVLELNASDDRTIDTVRDKIKSFSTQKFILPEGRHKIIILDEADSLTESAQQALRVIISDSSSSTRFVLACNESSKIIEPIQSRCCIFRFSRLKESDIKKNLERIIKIENIKYEEEGLKALVETSDGDMRNAVNNLQSTVVGFEELTKDNVYKIVDIPRPEIMIKLFSKCSRIDFSVCTDVFELLSEGYNMFEIVSVFSKIAETTSEINDDLRDKILKVVTKYKALMLDSYDSRIQLISMFVETLELFSLQK